MNTLNKVNLIETIIDVFKSVNWNPLTITMPQNGDVVTLHPDFYPTESDEKSESTFKGLTVTGACLPISGNITYVVNQLRNYDKCIAVSRTFTPTKRQNAVRKAPAYATA